MLRFGVGETQVKKGQPGGERWRLWVLVIALGLVVIAMRQLGKPQTAENLGRLFLEQPPIKEDVAIVSTPRSVRTSPNLARREQIDSRTAEPRVAHAALGNLAQVKDNTFFRPQEREPWFSIFDHLLKTTAEELAEDTIGALSYAQLLQQPEKYRGRVITLRGIVARCEVQYPEENELGITSYFRLWIRPEGGGQWPFVVYCLELPNDFPQGDNLRAEIEATGIFFKNWSYPYDDAMGVAPVVLAKGVQWRQPKTVQRKKTVTRRGVVWGMVGAAFLAGGVVWFALRHTRRSPHVVPDYPDTIAPSGSLNAEETLFSLSKSAAGEKENA